MESIENLYFNWLCAKVIRLEARTPSLTYYNLLSRLHNIEFVWLLSGDDNRCEDGVALRGEFLTTSGIQDEEEWHNLGCSVLEMLVAFSRRASFNTDIEAHIWFWHMLGNLGISDWNDAFILEVPEGSVEEVLYSLVWRQYDSKGRGGLFPIDETKKDQRHIEIWYQFCEYVETNPYLD